MAGRVRRVVVTGAAGAFGSATTRALRDRGAEVVGLDLVPGEGVLACDVTDPDQVTAAVGEAVRGLGGLDALVHFAGIGSPLDAGAPPAGTAQRILDVNLLGAWRVTAAAVADLVAARGRVVFVASELAYATLPFASAYAVSKRGLAAYADALRMEYGTHLSVTTVYPGYVPTPIHGPSVAAGLSLEGRVRKERVRDVVGAVLRALLAERPRRDTAATRVGEVELWVSRHVPRVSEALVRWRVRREVERGGYDGVRLAGGFVRRLRSGNQGGR